MVLITTHQIAALLAFLLAVTVYFLMTSLGLSAKLAVGTTILSVLVVAIFWSCVNLGAHDDDE